MKGGKFMALEKSCKYYLNSRCILGGGYCDLNCNQALSDGDSKPYDKIDILTQWRMEEEMEIRDSRKKLT
jgi:hypothetical protein